MFVFIVKRFGFLKSIPLVAWVFDSILRLLTLILNPALSSLIDDIEAEVLQWPGTTITMHKYGGLQFNYRGTEIGHIHSNGLLDLLLNLKTKQQLLAEGRATDHHTFIKSGWVSFYIKSESDKQYALMLLHMGYEKLANQSKYSNLSLRGYEAVARKPGRSAGSLCVASDCYVYNKNNLVNIMIQ